MTEPVPDHLADLARPPRRLPLSLRLRLLFGGLSNQIGWVVFGVGWIFTWIFAGNADLSGLHYLGEVEQARGTIVAREKTSATEGGSDTSDGDPIYRHDFEFVGPGGQERSGSSYSIQARDVGSEVTIEFPADAPEVSRIQGMRSALFPPWVLLVLLFPGVGLLLIGNGLRRGWRASRLLARGRPARGRLVNKRATNTKINQRIVYALTFEFSDDGTTHRMVAKTHLTERVEDDEEEELLFDPWKPANAVLLDILPARPEVDERGCFRPAPDVGRVLLLPVLTAVGLVAWLVVGFLV